MNQRRNPVKFGRAERNYAVQLRRLARHVGEVISGFGVPSTEEVPTLTNMLRAYAESLIPWATKTATQMLEEVNAKDKAAWDLLSDRVSVALRREIMNAPTGERMRELLAEQVTLIKSIPLDAAQRVHDWTIKGLEDSTRADEVAREIMRSGDVSASRAILIARTETSRTATVLTQARAEHIGSPGYVWQTSGDGDVRPSHKKMNGQFVSWGSPPTLDNMTGHAGSLPNCRCLPRIILPE